MRNDEVALLIMKLQNALHRYSDAVTPRSENRLEREYRKIKNECIFYMKTHFSTECDENNVEEKMGTVKYN